MNIVDSIRMVLEYNIDTDQPKIIRGTGSMRRKLLTPQEVDERNKRYRQLHGITNKQTHINMGISKPKHDENKPALPSKGTWKKPEWLAKVQKANVLRTKQMERAEQKASKHAELKSKGVIIDQNRNKNKDTKITAKDIHDDYMRIKDRISSKPSSDSDKKLKYDNKYTHRQQVFRKTHGA